MKHPVVLSSEFIVEEIQRVYKVKPILGYVRDMIGGMTFVKIFQLSCIWGLIFVFRPIMYIIFLLGWVSFASNFPPKYRSIRASLPIHKCQHLSKWQLPVSITIVCKIKQNEAWHSPSLLKIVPSTWMVEWWFYKITRVGIFGPVETWKVLK